MQKNTWADVLRRLEKLWGAELLGVLALVLEFVCFGGDESSGA
ncbi:hypothetical protein [Rappaport israeli]|nr:hypothetical protein [Rappaport israeli]